jgi:hypothetical protein
MDPSSAAGNRSFTPQVARTRFICVEDVRRRALLRSLPAGLRERLILYGALSTLDDAKPLGVALAVLRSWRSSRR